MIISKSNVRKIFPVVVLVLAVPVILFGCSMSNYGKLKSDPEVTIAFEAYLIRPGHKYYYRGTYSQPVVIVGINENYQLNSKMWLEIDPESQDFRKLIDKVSLQGSGSITTPWGFTIYDKTGRDVGIWYSAIRAAAVEINENGHIANLSPLRTVAKGDKPR